MSHHTRCDSCRREEKVLVISMDLFQSLLPFTAKDRPDEHYELCAECRARVRAVIKPAPTGILPCPPNATVEEIKLVQRAWDRIYKEIPRSKETLGAFIRRVFGEEEKRK